MGFLAAGFTAFYMFRLIYMTFFGEFKIKGAFQHVHENKAVMTMPLVVLSSLSVFFWYSANPIDPEAGWFYDLVTKPVPAWQLAQEHAVVNGHEAVHSLRAADETMGHNESVVHHENGEHAEHNEHAEHQAHVLGMIMSITLAFTGILLATMTYFWDKISAEAWANRLPGLHRALLNKWYVDEFYQATFIRGTVMLAKGISLFDKYVIDGIVNLVGRGGVMLAFFTGALDRNLVDGLVNGVADVTQYFGARLRQIQTGQIQQDLVASVVGVLVMLIIQVM